MTSVWLFGRLAWCILTMSILTATLPLQPQASPCVIFDGESGTGTGFSPSTSIVPCHYNSTNTLLSFIHASIHPSIHPSLMLYKLSE